MRWEEKKRVWILRATAQSQGLKKPVRVDWTRTVPGHQDQPPHAALQVLEEDVLAELQRRVMGEASAGGKPTLGAYGPLWLKSVRGRGKSVHYCDTRGDILVRHILPRFGHLRLAQIKPKHFEDWKPVLLAARTDDGAPYAHETLLTIWATFRRLLNWVSIQENVPTPITPAIVFDIQGLPPKEKDTVTPDELAAMLRHLDIISPEMGTLIVLGFALGLRFCELSALWWGDIDLTAGTLEIKRSQVRGKVGPPKTEATRRLVHLPPSVVEVLKTHRIRQAGGVETPTIAPDALVFPNSKGSYRFDTTIGKPLQELCDAAGVKKHLTAHCLRHTANDLLRRVASDVVVKSMIGHATGKSTRRYSHVDRDERLAAHAAAYKGAL